jgi:hypothetical protein
VVELWVPGPQAAPGHADLASLAGETVVMLADPGLSPGRRSVLLDLKRSAEERMGALTSPVRELAKSSRILRHGEVR